MESGQAWLAGDERPRQRVARSGFGMVASASTTAATIGASVLARGGNAFDAGLATAGAEWMTLPGSCGLGGDMFAVCYDARHDRVVAFNGSGEAARVASRDFFLSRGMTRMPLDGWHAAAVPGAPHAYATFHRELATLPLGELLAPAVRLADDGIVMTEQLNRSFSSAAKKLSRSNDAARIFLPGGAAPSVGARWRNPELAATIRSFVAEGAAGFYEGPVVEEILRASAEEGGLFGRDEFAEQMTETYEPPCIGYRGLNVYETRPPSQGIVVLEMLKMLEGDDLGGMGFGSARALHLLIEAKKLAFADRLRYCGDPRLVVQAPVARLLDAAYISRRRAAIDPDRAAEAVLGAPPELLGGDTSYFCIVDRAGNAASFIHSLSAGYGSGVVAGRTGVLLNNRAGRGFTLEEGHPNVFAGGKKTMHTLNCYLALRDGKPWLVGGTPGGDQQVQWNVQTITNLVDFGMDPRDAVEAPRWYSYPSTDPEHVGNPFVVRAERRFDEATFADLERRRHRIERLGPWAAGGAVQVITREPDGRLAGASDPRAGGVALGL